MGLTKASYTEAGGILVPSLYSKENRLTRVPEAGGSSPGGGGNPLGLLADVQAYFTAMDGYRTGLAQPVVADEPKQLVDDFIRMFSGEAEAHGTITAINPSVVPCGANYYATVVNLTFFPSVANVGAGTIWRSFIGMEGGVPTLAPVADTASWQSIGTPQWDTKLNGTNMGLYTSYVGMVGDFDGLGWTQVYMAGKTAVYNYQERIWAVGLQGQFSDGTVNGYVYRTISANQVQIQRAGQNRQFADTGNVVLNFDSPDTFYVTTGADWNQRTWSASLTSNCVPNVAAIGCDTNLNGSFTDTFPHVWATFLNSTNSSQAEMQNLWKLFKAVNDGLLALVP